MPRFSYNPLLCQLTLGLSQLSPARALSGGTADLPELCQAGCGQPAATGGCVLCVLKECSSSSSQRLRDVPHRSSVPMENIMRPHQLWETKQSLIILELHPYRPGPCTWSTTGEFCSFHQPRNAQQDPAFPVHASSGTRCVCPMQGSVTPVPQQ